MPFHLHVSHRLWTLFVAQCFNKCPSLTTLTPTTVLLTLHNIFELQVSTWARTPGTRVKVKCHTGLTLQGQDIVTCLATGDWDLSPLPKCIEPPPTTTTPPPSVDASLVLMIVLICVMVIVTVVMIVIGIALCHSYRRRQKNKLYRYPDYDENSIDTASEPHSISRRRREGMHMHTKHKHYHHHHHQPNSKYPNKPKPATAYNEQSQYPNRHKPPATAHSDHSQYPEITKPVMEYHAGKREHKSPKTAAENRAFESDDNFIVRDKRYPLPHKIQRSDEEYTITYVPFKVERNQKVHETTPEARHHFHNLAQVQESASGPTGLKAITYKRNDIKMHRNRRDQTHKALSAHAPQDTESVDDPQDQRRPHSEITAYYGGLFYDDTSDAEDEFWKRKMIKRDYFLWRDMPASFNSLRLPRPHYRP